MLDKINQIGGFQINSERGHVPPKRKDKEKYSAGARVFLSFSNGLSFFFFFFPKILGKKK